ncbi:hypothetical protein JA1_000835 [Spathaspora sp. JA1]|nr:hypothetical protein JA1_000835 [Spathaspora sp. JA1]
MADDFLRSSPSRIDPLLYTYSEDHKKKLPTHSILHTNPSIQTPISNKISNISKSQKVDQLSALSSTPSQSKQHPGSKTQQSQAGQTQQSQQQQQQQNQPPSYPSSASKFYSQFTNLTGWTPLISKTYSNESIVGFDATPNGGGINNFNKFLLSQQMGNSYSSNEIIDGFSLTPYLNNHTVNSIQNQLNNLTPFNEKTLQLSDFFIDSPINQTPIKDLQTITPSKFKMSAPNSAQRIKLLDTTKSATKRSITLVDTPPRIPQKLSILAKACEESPNEDNEGTENGDDEEEESEKEEEIKIGITDSTNKEQNVVATETPKKPLMDITNKPKLEFQTPAKQKLHAPSSPSTIVIVSPLKEVKIENDDDVRQPPSPTPQNKNLVPRMGIFSERKGKSSNEANSSTTKPKQGADKSKANKSKMQAGMNKFQIIFTDVHTLMNNKSKKLPKPKENHSQRQESTIQRPPPSTSKEMNISKEHSIVSHTSMNSSHLNISTDHSSFELEGNEKFFLDKVFDKQSPSYYGPIPGFAMPPPNHPLPPHPHAHAHMQMPPSQHPGQTPSGPSPNAMPQPANMMMLMSTPQHSNVYGPGMYTELSPYSFGYTQQPKFEKE